MTTKTSRTAVIYFFFFLLSIIPSALCFAEPRDIIFFFDVSDGVSDQDRQDYFAGFGKVLQSMNPGDHFTCFKIGTASHLSKQVCDGEIPIKEKGVTDTYYRDKVNQVIARQANGVRQMLTGQHDKTTSIMSAFIAASDHFKNSHTDNRYIFLFSDMVEENKDFNMTKVSPSNMLSAGEKNLKSLGLPNIKGVKVFCVGANQKDAKIFTRYQEFWKKIINEIMGAEMKHYQSSLGNVLQGGW